MVFWYILLQNIYVWLQWLGFEGKHAVLCIRGLNYQALIRDMLVFQHLPSKVTKSVFFKYFYYCSPFIIPVHYVHIFGKFHRFPYKSGSGATLLRVFGKISLISPKLYVLCIILVLLNHCIKSKFYAFCMFALANNVFCGIFIHKCQIPCYM